MGWTSYSHASTAATGRFDPITPAGRPRHYCSNACRQAAYRRRVHGRTIFERPGPEPASPRAFRGLETRVPIDARFELIGFYNADALRIDRVLLPTDTEEDLAVNAALSGRRYRGSPLRRAALAALTLLTSEGVAPAAVRLHQPWADQNRHAVGFECRYLPAMSKHFDNGGTEWLEVPRTSRSGALVALRIRPRAWRRLGPRRWHTYFA